MASGDGEVFWFYRANVQMKIHSLLRKAVTPHMISGANEVAYIEALHKAINDISKEIRLVA